MNKNDIDPEQRQAIKEAFDEAINTGPWDQSVFLRAMGKRLEKIRDDFLREAGVEKPEAIGASSNLASQTDLRSGQQEIYISLYSSSGDKLASWEKILANLPRQLVSRPIYADEENILRRIKSNINVANEAYVCAFINKTDIKVIPEDKIPHDKLGHPLLTVNDRAVGLDDISRFVHMSITYQYVEGRLVKKL